MRLPPPITSRTNGKVKALRQALSGRASAPGELTALEGENLLIEAGKAGVSLQTLFVREGEEATLRTLWARELQRSEDIVLSQEVFDSAVDTATPQGIAATFPIPAAQRPGLERPGAILLLENVQDPGNVGTLIRSAAAFGAVEVLLVGDCPNPWSPKVLRASAGAVFQVPVTRLSLADAVRSMRGPRRLFAAVPEERDAVSSMDARLRNPVLMIGSEGRGLSADALAMADERISIPCHIESLNAAVAGSILLYEWFRQNSLMQDRAATAEDPGSLRVTEVR